MTYVLRTVKRLWRNLSRYFSIFLYLRTTTCVSPLVISYHDFLILFSLSSLVFFHIYFLCTLGSLTLLIIS